MATARPITVDRERPSPQPDARRVTIVIPAHNEEKAIGEVLSRFRDLGHPAVAEVIVVDDGSNDRTAEIAAQHGARVVRHPRNRGYGAALKSGIRAVATEYVLTMDADGQHRFEDAVKLCDAIESGQPPDAVIGNRTQLLHSPLWRMPGKWVLKLLARVLTQRKIPDLNCGLRLVRREVLLRYLHLCPSGFSFSTTITIALLARGYSVDFVPIEVERRVGKSLVSVGTGFQTILLVLRLATLFNPLRVFLPLAIGFILFGAAWTVPYILDGQGVTVASLLAIVTGVVLFGLGLICDQVAQLRLERYE